tara:strand:- start:541 stop:741 length:201 start_codon:yes stop_codon:yes gene_type:complete
VSTQSTDAPSGTSASEATAEGIVPLVVEEPEVTGIEVSHAAEHGKHREKENNIRNKTFHRITPLCE